MLNGLYFWASRRRNRGVEVRATLGSGEDGLASRGGARRRAAARGGVSGDFFFVLELWFRLSLSQQANTAHAKGVKRNCIYLYR